MTLEGNLDIFVLNPSTSMSQTDESVDVSLDLAGKSEVEVGDEVSVETTVTESDVEAFASLSGDENPLHLEEDVASDSRFGERIAHGALVASYISTALSELPGTVVFLSQDAEFCAPVPIGSDIRVECRVVEASADNRYELKTEVWSGETKVIDGVATIFID